jgi:hypothetical protein
MRGFDMAAFDLVRPLRRSLPWLFWLALLLPLAQGAAAWHAYSHAPFGASVHADDPASPHAVHCDLCLIAAAVAGGALAASPPNLALLATRHAPPQPVATGVWQALPIPAYRSRAPPAASV